MIRICFLGCGKVARAHARRLRRHRDVQLAFASSDPARAGALAAELDARWFEGYGQALASDEVDAVFVCTTPDLHLPQVRAGLAAGKHVIVEKPPFPGTAELDQVTALAARAGRRVLVAENYFYKPLLARLRRLLADGVIGDVLFVHVNAIKRQVTGDWRDDPARAGGGALYEGGIHWIDLVNNLGLTVSEVRGFAPARRGPLERSMLVAFAFAEGATGSLSYSWEVPSTARGLRLSKIYGRQGSITFESNGLWVLVHGRRTGLYVPGLRDLGGYRAMTDDFVAALRDDREPAFTLARARRDLEVVEQAYRSAALPLPFARGAA